MLLEFLRSKWEDIVLWKFFVSSVVIAKSFDVFKLSIWKLLSANLVLPTIVSCKFGRVLIGLIWSNLHLRTITSQKGLFNWTKRRLFFCFISNFYGTSLHTSKSGMKSNWSVLSSGISSITYKFAIVHQATMTISSITFLFQNSFSLQFKKMVNILNCKVRCAAFHLP